MNVWTWFRLAAIAVVLITGCFVPLGPRAFPPLAWYVPVVIFVFCNAPIHAVPECGTVHLGVQSLQFSRSDTVFPFRGHHHDCAGCRCSRASNIHIISILRRGISSIGDGARRMGRRQSSCIPQSFKIRSTSTIEG